MGLYACSPWIHLASRMFFGMIVTRLVWMGHRLASSNSLTRYASAASWRHSIAADWNRRSVLKSWAISLTNLWKGNFRMSSAEVSESGRCLVEPQSPLCTCGVSPVSPASSPHVSSSSAPQSSPTCGGPARFSPLCKRCTGLAAFGQSGVTCGLLARLFASHHWFWWCIFAHLSALVRVIIITIAVSALLLASGPAYALTTRTGAVTTTCTACGLLPGHFGPICQFWTFVVRGVFVPIDFRHWDLLSMLLLEIGDEFSHLVGTPTSLCKSLLQSSHQAMVNEKGGEGFSSSDVGWARWQGEGICFFTCFGASAPSAGCGAFSSGVSSEEYSNTTFLSALPPGVGFFFGLPFLSLFPWLKVFLWCLFVQFAWFAPCNKSDLHLTFVW